MKKMRNIIMKRTIILVLSLLPGLLFAQKAGDVISGVISDSEGPLMMVNVVEVDESDRIEAYAITDINGEFSFRLVNPKNKLRVTYVGYETTILSFDKTYFDIVLKDSRELVEVEIVAERFSESSGLAIPVREISSAAQSISMADLGEGLGITTVDEAMQGRFAGLDIVMNSGNLGEGSSMRLRGVSTISGNANPLIVVDGHVWQNDKGNNFDYSGANEEQYAELLNVNPEDISMITVLKDAAAAAIWGSQGANGVIEIKTKRGTRGPTRVNYSYRFTGTWQPEGMRLMNGDQYTMFLKESYFNPTLSDNASDIIELNYDKSFSEYEMYNNNTDWAKAVKQFGQQHKHSLSISGGGGKANFRISAGYDYQTGSVIAQNLNRFTTRVALDYFISDRIKVVTNFNMVYSMNKRNAGDLLSSALRKMPNLAIYYEDEDGNSTGEYYHMLSTASDDLSGQAGIVNPIALAYEAKSNSINLNIQPEFQIVYNLLGLDNNETKLTYDGRIVFDIQNSSSDSYNPASLVTAGWSNSNSNKTSNSASKRTSITTTHSLTFVPYFENQDHSFMALLRGQMVDGNSKDQNSGVYGLPSGAFQSTALPGTISSFSTGAGKWRSLYATFSAHYAYKGKYIADFTSRTDGSTKFGDSKRWGTFPAVSLRWNIIDEPFMDGFKTWLSMLSIRPSWGINGDAPGSEGLFYSKYSSGNAYLNTPTVYPSNIRLNNLQWAQSMSWNLGFDFGFFNDKLTADVNLYSKRTTKMLMRGRAIPTSSGFSSLSYQNEGEMHNAGWELNINANRLIQKGKFNLNANLAFADNINELVEMDATILANMNGDFNYDNGQYLTYIQLNNAFGSIYGFKYKGVYQYTDYSEFEVPAVSGPNAPVVKDVDGKVIFNQRGRTKPMMFAYGTTTEYEFVGGDAIYEDINHDGNINELDIVYLGSSLPKMTGGFGFRMGYGRFSFNNQFNFRWGNKIINAARMTAESMYGNDNASAAVNWRWRVEGDITEIPRALNNYGYNYLASDRFVESGSFLRLNYTQISYSMDPKKIKMYGISQMSFNFNINNLFCLTRYSGADPEVGYGGTGVASDDAKTPRSRSFTAGVTIQF